MADDVAISGTRLFNRREPSSQIDIAIGPATVESNGSVTGGVFTAHSIQMPWTYTLNAAPAEVALGTALHVPLNVTIDNNPGGLGPQNATGFFGPRGIVNVEGLARFAQNMTVFGFAPIGYADTLCVANNAGATRTLVPSWSYMSARSVIADAATCTLDGTDTNEGGAAFVDTPVYCSVDSGTLNGTTNTYELTSFFTRPALIGNVALSRRIGLDVQGVHTLDPGSAHWSGAGTFDATTASLTEEIGVRVGQFTVGATKIGLSTAHPIRLMSTNLTHSGTLTLIDVEAARTFTLQSSGLVLGYSFASTLVYDDDANTLAAGLLFQVAPTLKNVNGEARTIGAVLGWVSLNSIPTFTGDGAAVTVAGHYGLRDIPVAGILSGGTVTLTDVRSVHSGFTVNSGATVTARRGYHFADATGSGTVTTQIGMDIAVLTKGGTNIGIRNASTTVWTPSVQTLTAVGNAIVADASVKRLDNTSGGSLTLTSAPTIADGQDGQRVLLFNSSANNVVIQDQGTLANSNLRLSATAITLATRDSIELVFSSTVGDWIQVGQVNVL